MRELLIPQEVADVLRIKLRTVYDYIKSGKLKAIKLGKGYRIEMEDLAEFCKTNKFKP